MTIDEIKKAMKEWKDFYGGDICQTDEIDKAKTKADLSKVLDDHNSFLDDCARDAYSHVENFRKKLGINL